MFQRCVETTFDKPIRWPRIANGSLRSVAEKATAATSRQVSLAPFTLEEEVRNKNGSHAFLRILKIPQKPQTSKLKQIVLELTIFFDQRQHVDAGRGG